MEANTSAVSRTVNYMVMAAMRLLMASNMLVTSLKTNFMEVESLLKTMAQYSMVIGFKIICKARSP